MSLLSVFGTKPADSIFNPAAPFAVRLNCQSGQLALSESEFIGNSAEISIIKVARFFGDLGNTKRSEWLQIFYIAAPGCTALPKDTVCVSYIKTRSLAAFNQGIIKLIGEGVNPAEGIFTISFVRHSAGDRNYFSVKFDWRNRTEGVEQEQLELIGSFLATQPGLIDLNGTRQMLSVDGLPSMLIAELVDGCKAQPDEEPAVILHDLLATAAESLPIPELTASNGRKRK
jgi:hypothetical protein